MQGHDATKEAEIDFTRRGQAHTNTTNYITSSKHEAKFKNIIRSERKMYEWVNMVRGIIQ